MGKGKCGCSLWTRESVEYHPRKKRNGRNKKGKEERIEKEYRKNKAKCTLNHLRYPTDRSG